MAQPAASSTLRARPLRLLGLTTCTRAFRTNRVGRTLTTAWRREHRIIRTQTCRTAVLPCAFRFGSDTVAHAKRWRGTRKHFERRDNRICYVSHVGHPKMIIHSWSPLSLAMGLHTLCEWRRRHGRRSHHSVFGKFVVHERVSSLAGWAQAGTVRR